MRAKPATGGIVLLILAALLAAEALGPYLSLAQAPSSITVPFYLMVVAVILAGGGIVLLNAARLTEAEEREARASTVEDPHHPPPIRSPVVPVTSAPNPYSSLAGGVTVSEDEDG